MLLFIHFSLGMDSGHGRTRWAEVRSMLLWELPSSTGRLPDLYACARGPLGPELTTVDRRVEITPLSYGHVKGGRPLFIEPWCRFPRPGAPEARPGRGVPWRHAVPAGFPSPSRPRRSGGAGLSGPAARLVPGALRF